MVRRETDLGRRWRFPGASSPTVDRCTVVDSTRSVDRPCCDCSRTLPRSTYHRHLHHYHPQQQQQQHVHG